MINTDVDRKVDLCPACKALDEKFSTPQHGHTQVVHFLKNSLHQDCVSCKTLSDYFSSDKLVVALFHNGPEDDETQSASSEELVEPCAESTNTKPLKHILMWDSADATHDHTFLPAESHIPGPGKYASADLIQAKQWLESCRSNHASDDAGGRTCTVQPVTMKTPLRIIDCSTLRVRELMPGESYACLSYVWGNVAPAKVAFGSQIDPGSISKTTSDAIYVAKQLGVPRLWVDQYCIVQNESIARNEAIASMNLIYGGAEVTIAAASGIDASHGLPGVLGTDRSDLIHGSVTLGSRQFVEEPVQKQLEQSHWNSRGWTFQEAVLSVRLLVFTDRQMYFQCNKAHHLEHYRIEDPLSGQRIFLFTGTDLQPLATFPLLTEYFPKQLSFAKDSLKAIEGILEACGKDASGPYQCRHFYGIPLPYFTDGITGEISFSAQGLVWWTSRQSTETEVKETLAPDESGLPSWTWASQKSRSRSSIMTLDFCNLDASWLNFQDLRLHITNRHGETVDVFDFVTSSLPEHYSNYFPWIDVTSWIVQSQITTSDLGYSKTVFGGMGNSSFKFDEGVPQNDETITAIFIGTGEAWSDSTDSGNGLVFLLIRPTTPNTFSRVGLWYLYEEAKVLSLEEVMADPEPTLLKRFTEDPERYLKSCWLSHGVVVEKRTVRLV
ncbi:hypothetical protein COCVIDRAFT_39840 [Bipolaris victoriae FI3]|uniref:Heterokaryon incompatibility domain-containing protein n=1 Tax=Bipolaris victoriae (strain FI3) TaxID=930091 RepID=W7ECG9_BIPV3|nr:hypothetical protein COCVIDRAFT_39840 [Bipolaris victoriae FI3]